MRPCDVQAVQAVHVRINIAVRLICTLGAVVSALLELWCLQE